MVVGDLSGQQYRLLAAAHNHDDSLGRLHQLAAESRLSLDDARCGQNKAVGETKQEKERARDELEAEEIAYRSQHDHPQHRHPQLLERLAAKR